MIKGAKGGQCARTVCSNKDAVYFNKSTLRYYCAYCASKINSYGVEHQFQLYGAPLCELRKP